MTEEPIRRLGAWVAGLQPDAVEEPVRHAVRRSLLDYVGVAIAGTRHPVSAQARRLAAATYAQGPARGLGRPESGGLSAPGAAFINGVAGHVLDFDDTCYVGIVHGTAIVFPAALALAEERGVSGETLLTAFLAGVETVYALGRLFGDRLYYRGVWNTGALGAVGAAAAAARVIGLPPDRTADALSLAACQVMGLRACFGSAGKPLLAGRCAETGVAAALAAEAGADGPMSILEAESGWASVLNDGHIDERCLDGLGDPFIHFDPGVAIKIFPVCSAAQAAVEGVLDLLQSFGLSGAQVAAVRCEVTRLVRISLRYPEPRSPAQAQFSMPFAVGCALAFGALTPAMLTPETLREEALRSAMQKVEIVEVPEETLHAGSSAACPEGTRITMTVDDGQRLETCVPVASGMPTRPLSDERLVRKFRACVEPILGIMECESLRYRLETIEELSRAGLLLDGMS